MNGKSIYKTWSMVYFSFEKCSLDEWNNANKFMKVSQELPNSDTYKNLGSNALYMITTLTESECKYFYYYVSSVEISRQTNFYNRTEYKGIIVKTFALFYGVRFVLFFSNHSRNRLDSVEPNLSKQTPVNTENEIATLPARNLNRVRIRIYE